MSSGPFTRRVSARQDVEPYRCFPGQSISFGRPGAHFYPRPGDVSLFQRTVSAIRTGGTSGTDAANFAGLSRWGIWRIHLTGGGEVGGREATALVGPVAERPSAGLTAAAERDGPLVVRQEKLPAGVVSDPKPHLRLAVHDRKFDDQWTVFPAANRDHRAAGRRGPRRGVGTPLRFVRLAHGDSARSTTREPRPGPGARARPVAKSTATCQTPAAHPHGSPPRAAATADGA